MEAILNSILDFIKDITQTVFDFSTHRLAPAILIFVIGFFTIFISMKILRKLLDRTKLENPAFSLLISVIRVALYLILSLIVASSLGIDVTGVIALASVLTLAVSLSVQDALTNLIGGFTLLYTKPFVIGDFVEIGGQSGTVQQIGLTYTKVLTPDRKTVSIPNKTVVAAQIVNFTAEGTRRVDITINVAYTNDPEAVLEALKKAADVPTVLKDPVPYTAVSTYGESTVGYMLQVWCKSDDYWTTMHGINKNIRVVFREEGIIMTYPHLNIHLDK
jgi:small conductance mechanosensitive channel